MPIDKSWITHPNRRSAEYKKGVDSFIEMCKEQIDESGDVRCACATCHNTELISFKLMKSHMYIYGFCRSYKNWTYHGETSAHPVRPVVEDVAPRSDMVDVIEDVMAGLMEEDANLDEGNSDTERYDGSDDYEKLLKEVETELYPGCTEFSSLDFIAQLMHIKVKNKWSNSSFDEMLLLLRRSHPAGNKVPASHNAAKNTLKMIGLGYESIHVCKNDCALFWKENESLDNCPICKESRWVNDKNTKRKGVAKKVLRYFPVTPRLRRLYCSRHTAKDMIWHSTGRSKDGTMCHPVDGSAWKDFDKNYPDFSKEPRNVRLGLAADGFNPFGNMSSAHSTWPVILTTYNLPPWLCMKESSFMLTLLIPGPKSPGKDMDVFLRPLVDELKELWQVGVRTKDAATNTIFTMKAALLWTINDFPARSSLSGWSGQGYLACPTCNKDTPSYWLTNKVAFVGHRRFLNASDPWRSSLEFNGQPEKRPAPRKFSNADILAQHNLLDRRVPGKHPDFGGITKKRAPYELNWSKRSIFFDLEYWSSQQLKHNLDVMHIERNVCDSLLGTLLMNNNTKDTSNARVDLQNLKIRKKLWLSKNGTKWKKPHPKYSFSKEDRKLFCQFIKDVKLPDGFGSNISKRVTDNNTNITGLKSHDCHILMQRLIPIGVKGFLAKDTYTPMVDLSTFFKQLCSRTLKVEDMRRLGDVILIILCKLELIYPPAFFDIMVHLLLHLPDEAILGGPIHFRWMYPFERYMKKLKNYVRNKARPEACIAEGYVAEEALLFCSRYLQDVKSRFNRPDRNEDLVVEKRKLWVFESICRPTSAKKTKLVTSDEKLYIEWFVLDNCQEVRQYMEEFESEHPQRNVKTEFQEWFLRKVFSMKIQNSPEFHKELYALSMRTEVNVYTYTGCIVNGVRFMILDRDSQRTTQNSGVLVEDGNNVKYYGQLEEIIEVHYPYGYSTVLFRCKWFNPCGYSYDNGITSINTEREWNKEDQLIFASQAKQVFYIREPPRGNQTKSCKWVVENVNHRTIWDLPLDEDVSNDSVHNDPPDRNIDVDVVHSNSSSNFNFAIDFSQYNLTNYDTNVSDDETDPPTVNVNRMSDVETDYDEDDPDYDTEASERDTTGVYDGESD